MFNARSSGICASSNVSQTQLYCGGCGRINPEDSPEPEHNHQRAHSGDNQSNTHRSELSSTNFKQIWQGIWISSNVTQTELHGFGNSCNVWFDNKCHIIQVSDTVRRAGSYCANTKTREKTSRLCDVLEVAVQKKTPMMVV